MPPPPTPPRARACLRHAQQPQLLDLPAELRQLILTFALRDPAGVTVDDDQRMRAASLPTLASLQRVSRSVRAEALAVFAAANAFTLANAGALLFLLRLVGRGGRAQLRRAAVVFARPTGRGFVDDGAALKAALALLRADCARVRLCVELALRAVQAPFNHAHADAAEPCFHFPRSARNRAGPNFWIHPASVEDTPHADGLRELVRRAVVVRWTGSPRCSFSSACDDSMDFVRRSEEWLRPRGDPGFEGYVCEWEGAADGMPALAREKVLETAPGSA